MKKISQSLALFLLVAPLIASCEQTNGESDRQKQPGTPSSDTQKSARPLLDRPTVVLVIMDTVRRDRTTVCGYTKPTTPNLAKLANRGTTFCRMVIPGTWTLPVHASIFTGKFPHDHGADFIPAGISVPGFSHLSMSAMHGDLPTLAGLFRKAGYQTALVSTNPVLHPSTGLARDFNHVRVYPAFALGRQGAAFHAVDRLAGEGLRPDKPLFLAVNISLAHSPYEKVPAGTAWTEATDEVMSPYKNGLFVRYVSGQMPPEESGPILQKLRSAYDWGVWLADKDLGRTLGVLAKRGWLNDQSIVAVTSDHGELLGEHGLLDHGRTVARENVDVFAVVQAPGLAPGKVHNGLVQSQDLFPTLLKAAGIQAPVTNQAIPLQTPKANRLVITVSQPDPHWTKITSGKAGSKHLVAVQKGEQRVVWTEPDHLTGEKVPDNNPESEPLPVPEKLAPVARRIAKLALKFTGQAVELPEETVESLRSLGYVQ